VEVGGGGMVSRRAPGSLAQRLALTFLIINKLNTNRLYKSKAVPIPPYRRQKER
jgi:hypothetical protein